MLVLTRKVQQQIRIGDDITVTILQVKGNTIRVGIEAPREVRVVRGELPVFDDGSPEGEAPSQRQPAADSEEGNDGDAPLAGVLRSRNASASTKNRDRSALVSV
jgi:carbon storage regulator CsrA